MLRPKVLVFMLPLLLPIGQPRTSADGLNGAGADSAPAPATRGWIDADHHDNHDNHDNPHSPYIAR